MFMTTSSRPYDVRANWRGATESWAGALWGLLLLSLVTLVCGLALSRAGVLGGDGATAWGTSRLLVTVLAVISVAAIVSRFALWLRYAPVTLEAKERRRLPQLTVVIPAFNEGSHVRLSIESVLASRYPLEKLRVIVVNDGSKDDTGAHIDAMTAAYPKHVTAVHQPANRGKRHALYEGFRRCRTPFVATLDSDSVLDPDALANLVAPMVRDRRIGGVAGQVAVMNRSQTLITRMLGVCYLLGFDFARAYQSGMRTVWCCPGAIQAYRVGLIRPHLKRWRDQTFLGARCTNGDDHAMTNLVLSLGADTTYQRNATVRTLVPKTYKALCKMYVRWGRSATREGLRALRFAPRRAARLGPVLGPLMLLDAVLKPVQIVVRCVAPIAMVVLAINYPEFVPQVLGLTLLGSLVYGLVYLRSERSTQVIYGVLYSWYSLFALAWVQPYASLTVRRNGWMTRG